MQPATKQRDEGAYAHEVWQTRQSLNSVPDATLVGLTGLGIDAVQALKQEVAEIFPASNLPAFLLQGLVQIEDRALRPEKVAADLEVLFRGSKQIGLYGTFLAAPALLLHGYQRLLSLAGKDVASAFPDGPWQFYTEFGLREDAARHCVETVGFQRATPDLSALAAATCWVAAAIAALFAYDDLLEHEWTERAIPHTLDVLLAEQAAAELGRALPRKAEARERAIADHGDVLRQRSGLDKLRANWATQRPYGVAHGTTLDAYCAGRRAQFRAYLDGALAALPQAMRADLDRRVAEQRRTDLPAYQRQLTPLLRLEAGRYQDRRVPLTLAAARVAVVVGGRYYLLDACARDRHGQLLMFPLDGDERSAGTALTLVERPDGLEDRYGHVVDIDRRGRVRVGGTLLGRLRPPPLADVKSALAAVSEHARTSLSTDNDEHAPADLLLAVAPRSYDEEHHNALRPTLARHEVCGLTDAELVEGLKTLDDEAYRSVIECYGKPLYGYIYSLTADHDLSEDILSETYLRMVEKIDTYTYYGAPFKAWLYRIAHNLAMTTLKRGSRVMGSDALEKVARPVTDVALRVEVRLEHEAVRMALGELTEEQQQVLLLRFVAELSPPEIAQAMEKSEVAVRQMQFRALRSLGRLLEQQA